MHYFYQHPIYLKLQQVFGLLDVESANSQGDKLSAGPVF